MADLQSPYRVGMTVCIGYMQLLLMFALLIAASPLKAQEKDPCHCAMVDSFKNTFPLYAMRGQDDSIQYVLNTLKTSPNPYCLQTQLHWKANIHCFRAEFDSAKSTLGLFKKALDQHPCLKNEAMYYDLQGLYYSGLGKLDSASQAYLGQLAVLKKLGLKDNIGTALTNLAYIFFQLEEPEKALSLSREARPIVAEIRFPQKRSSLNSALSGQYFEYCESYRMDSLLLDTAVILAQWALKEGKECRNPDAIGSALSVLGAIAKGKKQYPQALEYFREQVRSMDRDYHHRALMVAYLALSEVYMETGDYARATITMDSATYFSAHSDHKMNDIELWEHKYELAKRMGKWEDALAAHEYFVLLKDSLAGEEKLRIIADLEKKYETDLKQATINELALQQENSRLRIRELIFGLIAIALALALILFWFRKSVRRSRKTIIDSELRLNRMRMDPHFFFNALAAIQVEAIKDNSMEVSDYLGKFARIMRLSLESTYHETSSLALELEFLTKYMDLQKIRFSQRFAYIIQIDPDLDPHTIALPSMILQPFIENTIEHGFRTIDYPGELKLYFEKEGKSILVKIQDNGMQAQDSERRKDHFSRATQIIRTRLSLLQKKTGVPTSLEMTATESAGFKVLIRLPLMRMGG